MAVGAGDGHGEHVSDGDVGGNVGVEDEDVAGLAVLSDDPGAARPVGEWQRGSIASYPLP